MFKRDLNLEQKKLTIYSKNTFLKNKIQKLKGKTKKTLDTFSTHHKSKMFRMKSVI